MPQLALCNMIIGFVIIFLSASFGTFIVAELTDIFVTAPHLANDWQRTLSQSAHGHTSLFGFIHVLFGLTIPYSKLAMRWKFWQTLGLFAGTIGIGPLLIWKSFVPPTDDYDALSLAIGFCLTLFLFSLIFHAFGIFLKMREGHS